jgi:transcriptional regulator with XRE-family HTH domain
MCLTPTPIGANNHSMGVRADFAWLEVGQRIRARRLVQEKTQQLLASQAGVTQNAIFRLEIGNTNPQLSTLRAVAEALGTTVRELVCGVPETDARLCDRLARVQRILEAGDPAAIRAMDYGLEIGEALLDRTGGILQQTPPRNPVGNRAIRRNMSKVTARLDDDRSMPSSEPWAGSGLVLPRKSKKDLERMKEIAAVGGWRGNDAPGLPVGSANMDALPKSVWSKEHHGISITPTALSDRQRAKA